MKNKKRVYLSVLFIALLFCCFQEQALAQERRVRFELGVEISFGRKSRDCTGFGLCIFITDFSVTATPSARLLPDESVVQLMLPHEYAIKYNEQVGGDRFLMEEDLQLAQDVSKELGSEEKIILRRGEYPIKKTKKGLLINISI